MHYDRELDARRIGCFMLTLRTKQSLDAMTRGQVLKVLATDPGTVNEFNAFTRLTGHELLAASETGGVYADGIEVRAARHDSRDGGGRAKQEARAEGWRGCGFTCFIRKH